MSTARLLAARWLLDAGAGASACTVLHGIRGREANDIREASANATLARSVCALVVHGDDGLVFPLRPVVGLPISTSPDMLAACASAAGAVRSWFGVRSLPALRLELEELLSVSGTSLGLPAALAFVSHFAPASTPTRAVLATGRIDAEGRVLPVSEIASKLRAADAEEGDRVVLVPKGQRADERQLEVATLAEAIAIALGPAKHPDPSLVALDTLLERARGLDAHDAVALLSALDVTPLSSADRARIELELGTALRHLGRTDEAAALHASAHQVLSSQRLVVGAETAERYELEVWITAMDHFRLDEAEVALSSRLHSPFMSARNELRGRGMLAQVASMRGDFARAVRIREGNLPLHDLSDDLSRVLPGTLCYLALDSARAGEVEGFERYAAALLRATPKGDAAQWRYTAYALVRSLVALGRDEEGIGWIGGSAFANIAAPGSVLSALGNDAISTHPETSLVRALVRAWARQGELARAEALADRIAVSRGSETSDLSAWVARLVDFEIAAAEGPSSHDRLARARADLPKLHAEATAYHGGLLTCSVDDLRVELDRVFY